MIEQLRVLEPRMGSDLWSVRDRDVADLRSGVDHGRLIYCFPGSFDLPESYNSWTHDLSRETNAEVVVHDFRSMSPVRRVSGGEGRREVYRADFRPADCFDGLAHEVAKRQPTELAVVGYAGGAIDAAIATLALRILGFPVACTVAIAPSLTFGSPDPNASSSVGRRVEPFESPAVELRNTTPPKDKEKLPWLMGRLSCLRYANLHEPHSSPTYTVHMPTEVLNRYQHPFGRILPFGTSGNPWSSGPSFTDLTALVQAGHYDSPTVFLGLRDSWYSPPGIAMDLARQTCRRAAVGYREAPVGYDFRASQREDERLTELLADVLGQAFSTRTITAPMPMSRMLKTGLPDVSGRERRERETVVLAAARPFNLYGESVIRAAAGRGAELAVFASRAAEPVRYAQSMRVHGVTGVVVDFPTGEWRPPMLEGFATLDHPAVQERNTDLPWKRGVGLSIGGRKVTSDDDIRWTPEKLALAFGALEHYEIAGFQPIFEDLSVLGHADMLAGGKREGFISFNSLGITEEAAREAFNDPAYNEDRHAMHKAIELGSAALLGTIEQAVYDPFDTPERARQQVFGEVLHEGLYFLLGIGVSYLDVKTDFWQYMMSYYARQIDDVAKRLEAKLDMGDQRVPRALASMRTMKTQLNRYTPADFYSYIQAWHGDITERWPEAVDRLPQGMTVPETVAYHGLDKVITIDPPKRRSAHGLVY